MHPVSEDLPDYLKSSFSKHSNTPRRRQGKHYKSPLTQGISLETPDFFKLKGVPVLTAEIRSSLNDTYSHAVSNNCRRSSQTPYLSKNIYRKSSIDPSTDLKYCPMAGLATGTQRPLGEFDPINPKINRNLSSDQQTLENILRKMLKSRLKRKTDLNPNPVSKFYYKVSKKSHASKKSSKIEYIDPKLLSQQESRVLYNIT